MNIGEVISALVLCASSWDDDKNRLLLLKAMKYELKGSDAMQETIEAFNRAHAVPQ